MDAGVVGAADDLAKALAEALDAAFEGAFSITGVGSGLGASNLTALDEITNRRRIGDVGLSTDGSLALGIFGLLLLRLGLDAFFGAAALRFNINNKTEKYRAGSEKIKPSVKIDGF